MPAIAVPARRALLLLAIVVVAGLVAGCTSNQDASASFDPAAACNGADSQVMAGAYPELEALVPATLAGVKPTSLVSGRLCSANTLGTLFDDGIRETHFGSAVWDRGGGSGIQMTIMEAAGLTVANAIKSYQSGAANAPKVHALTTSNVTVNGLAGMRLDIENDDFQQEVVIWPTNTPGQLRVLIASNIHAPDLEAALAAFR